MALKKHCDIEKSFNFLAANERPISWQLKNGEKRNAEANRRALKEKRVPDMAENGIATTKYKRAQTP